MQQPERIDKIWGRKQRHCCSGVAEIHREEYLERQSHSSLVRLLSEAAAQHLLRLG
jgi:hypothetical protein